MSVKSGAKRIYKRDWHGRFARGAAAKVAKPKRAGKRGVTRTKAAMRRRYGTKGHRTARQAAVRKRDIKVGVATAIGIAALATTTKKQTIKSETRTLRRAVKKVKRRKQKADRRTALGPRVSRTSAALKRRKARTKTSRRSGRSGVVTQVMKNRFGPTVSRVGSARRKVRKARTRRAVGKQYKKSIKRINRNKPRRKR